MTEPQKENEFLKQENYYEGYQKSIEANRNNPDAVELDKLMFLVFRTEDGKKLLEVIKERFLLPGFVSPHHQSAQQASLYFEGFKEAYRMILGSIRSHEQRIEAEKKQP